MYINGTLVGSWSKKEIFMLFVVHRFGISHRGQGMYINGKRVELGGLITYRKSADEITHSENNGPHRGYVCDIFDSFVQVRSDGWRGHAPLLTVLVSDILAVES